jgi:hypothetical protein
VTCPISQHANVMLTQRLQGAAIGEEGREVTASRRTRSPAGCSPSKRRGRGDQPTARLQRVIAMGGGGGGGGGSESSKRHEDRPLRSPKTFVHRRRFQSCSGARPQCAGNPTRFTRSGARRRWPAGPSCTAQGHLTRGEQRHVGRGERSSTSRRAALRTYSQSRRSRHLLLPTIVVVTGTRSDFAVRP